MTKMRMAKVIGIDLETTNSAMAVMESGEQKRMDEAYFDTSMKSLPNKETNISPATPLSKKNNIGIEKENIKTFLNLTLIAETSSLFFALDSSGKIISKLAASN